MTMEYHKEKCQVCGKCVDACPMEARTIKDGEVEVDEYICVDCQQCTEVCEHDASQIPEEKIAKKAEGA